MDTWGVRNAASKAARQCGGGKCKQERGPPLRCEGKKRHEQYLEPSKPYTSSLVGVGAGEHIQLRRKGFSGLSGREGGRSGDLNAHSRC